VNGGEQTRKNIHAVGGIQTHGLCVQTIKAYASERATTETGCPHNERSNQLYDPAALLQFYSWFI
jgi:hypothetical protein